MVDFRGRWHEHDVLRVQLGEEHLQQDVRDQCHLHRSNTSSHWQGKCQRCHLLVICRSQDSVEVVVFDGDPEKTTAMVMNYFRSRSCSQIPATIWCSLWKYKRGRHLANVSDKDFFRLNIIGPPTEEQAAPQKVDLNIFTGLVVKIMPPISGGEVQRGWLGQELHSASVASPEREIHRNGPKVPEGPRQGATWDPSRRCVNVYKVDTMTLIPFVCASNTMCWYHMLAEINIFTFPWSVPRMDS